MESLTEGYADQIKGTISCFDRVVITGLFPDLCHSKAMRGSLASRGFKIFDFTEFVGPMRDEIRANAEKVAKDNGITIEYITRKTFRKEDRIKAIVEKRGKEPGLVHIFSAMEPCMSYRPWYDKAQGKAILKMREAKCIHYYFYFS